MNIFPYSLVRLGGESFEQWAKMNTESITQEVATIIKLKEDKKEKKEQLCDALFTFIEELKDPAHQNLVQNLRRDLFNNRKIKNNKLNQAKEVLSTELNDELDTYLQLNIGIKSRIQNAEENYKKTIHQNRTVFKEIANSDTLKKGLLLSSKSLLERLDSYTKKEVNDFRKKEFQIEQGLIKYLTRMYTKTSPFSTFTNLSIAELTEQDQSSAITIKHTSQKKVNGHIRVNNYLLKYLLDLFTSYREAYLWLFLRPNPTIENKEDHFLFLTNNNNIESFQRIPFNPVVELIIETAKENKSGIRFNQLITVLQDNIEAEPAELEGYIKQLIDYGCLEYNVGVSGIDPDWDLRLVERLAPLKENNVPHIGDLIDVLVQLRKMGNQYAEKDDKGRKEILSQAFDKFRAICMAIHKEADLPEEERRTPEEHQEEWKKKQEELKAKEKEEKNDKNEDVTDKKEENGEVKEEEVFKHKTSTLFSFKPEQIFYEDTTREVKALLNQNKINAFVKKLDGLLQSLKVFKGMEDEKVKMKHYFLQKYNNSDAIDLLTFYEDFFREYKKPLKEYEEEKKKEAKERAEKEKEGTKDAPDIDNKQEEEKKKEEEANPFLDIPELKERNESIKKWNEKYTEALKSSMENSNGQVNLTGDEIKSANQQLNVDLEDSEGTSFGSFIQFYIDNHGELKAVLNGTFSGYGKMLSRFLHIFDNKVTDELRNWNNNSNKDDSIFIEDCDASYFNANLHPPLMPNEIWMPGGHNTLSEEQQIPITDFTVSYDDKANELVLRHKPTGKKSHVFDLGFQGSMGRSQLFQLLEKFSKAEYLFVQPIANTINSSLAKREKQVEDKEKKEPQIHVLPRIVYEDQIIVQRKTWNVPKVLIPEKLPINSDWEYYLKVNEWRIKNAIPEEVFVFINPDRWVNNIDPKLSKKLTRDDYKPQYIDFRNPLLINLLEKLIAKAPVSIKIQEMLPDSGQMLKIDGERFVSEFVVQWYK
jgi:lantibiotic biosynthesis protein